MSNLFYVAQYPKMAWFTEYGEPYDLPFPITGSIYRTLPVTWFKAKDFGEFDEGIIIPSIVKDEETKVIGSDI